MRERLFRLGLPLLAYTLLVGPVLEYASERADGEGRAFWPFVSHAFWGFDPGPTWFLEALLGFSAAYALWRALRPAPAVGQTATGRGAHPLRGRDVGAVALGIAIVSFAARFAFPLGSEQLHLQLAIFPQYAVLFAFGVAAGRRAWLEGLPPHLARRCGLAALATALILPLVLLAGGFFAGNDDAFAGGWHWQALGAPVAEGTLAPCASVWLVALFRRRLDHKGSLARRLGDAAYGAFLLHPPVVVGLALAVHPLAAPAPLKLAVVLGAGISASFGVAILVTRLGPVARVIGVAPAAPAPVPRPAGSTA